MIRPEPPKSTGIAGLVLLFCAVALIAGVGFDVLSRGSDRFGIATQPGARAVLGVAVVVGLILIAHALRFALGRQRRTETEGEPHAGDHT